VLHRTGYTYLETTVLHLSGFSPILADNEAPHIDDAPPTDTAACDDIPHRLATIPRLVDYDVLLQITQATAQQENHTYRLILIPFTSSALTTLLVGAFTFHTTIRHLLRRNKSGKTSDPKSLNATLLTQANPLEQSARPEGGSSQTVFASYCTHS
jgi:hypothetical protein